MSAGKISLANGLSAALLALHFKARVSTKPITSRNEYRLAIDAAIFVTVNNLLTLSLRNFS